MAAETRGSIYETKNNGYGIRWLEGDRRRGRSGFATKTEARRWLAEHLRDGRLRDRGPSPDITLDEFCDLFLERHGAVVSRRTRDTLEERLRPAREAFGPWPLRELEGAADDVAAWRTRLAPGSRYRLTSALRQALGSGVRWGYLGRNPAVDAGRNPMPRFEEQRPFSREQVDAAAAELGPFHGAIAVVAAETGLRTAEWVALERRDVDRDGATAAVAVQRRYAGGALTPYPKTARSRRRVPLTARALAALEALPPRLDTPLLLPAARGGYIDLDNWRLREWYVALDSAGIERRGPYHLRHTFATEALAAGISIFELARLMGTSTAMIDERYGHLARDSEAAILTRLDARSRRGGMEMAWESE